MEFLIYYVFYFVLFCIFVLCTIFLIRKSFKKEFLNSSEKLIGLLAIIYYSIYLGVGTVNSLMGSLDPFKFFSNGINGDVFIIFSSLVFVFTGIWYIVGLLKDSHNKRILALLVNFLHLFGLIFIIKIVDYFSTMICDSRGINALNTRGFIEVLIYLAYFSISLVVLFIISSFNKDKPSRGYLTLSLPIIILLIFNFLVPKDSFNKVVYEHSLIENINTPTSELPSPKANTRTNEVVYGKLQTVNSYYDQDSTLTIDDLLQNKEGRYNIVSILYPDQQQAAIIIVDQNTVFIKNGKAISKENVLDNINSSSEAGATYETFGDRYLAKTVYLK